MLQLLWERSWCIKLMPKLQSWWHKTKIGALKKVEALVKASVRALTNAPTFMGEPPDLRFEISDPKYLHA